MEQHSEFERIVEVSGAFDKRSPDPKTNYGIGGMRMRFILKGPLGAVQFVVCAPIHLEYVSDELFSRGGTYNPFKAIGADIGYHAKVPQYEGQQAMEDNCPYTGGPCYYDGSGLQAAEFMPTFLAKGSDAVWPMLEERYKEWLEGGA